MKDDLLNKFAKSKMSPNELDVFVSMLEPENEESLKRELYQEWISYSTDKELDELKKEQLHPGISSSFSRFRLFWYVAAAAALIVLSCLSVSLFKVRQDISLMSSREIVVEANHEGQTYLTLPDGTLVRLNSKSKLKYASDFGVTNRHVEMSGEGYFDVSKESEYPFVVSTQGMNIIVKGTKFNVYAYEGLETMEMSLVEGSVLLEYEDFNTEVQPNEKVVIDKITGRVNQMETDNRQETLWMKNTLIFMHAPLYNVIDALQRKFGVIFRCSDEIVLSDLYTGTFTNRSLDEILDILHMHYNFKYEITDNTIKITLN